MTFVYSFDNISCKLSSLDQILKDFGGFIVKKFFSGVAIFLLFGICVFFGIYMFNTAAENQPQILKRGMDVSKWNGDIDWGAVKNSGAIDFAI